ncbi:MAG: hypothetical protein HOP10_03780 [Chitinophagaceae bacterium]|nr:hypothetical protein [Chitinophagaceae bacterium]
MNDLDHKTVSPSGGVIYYRLIALWALCEAMLGAIIFTFRIPASGLVIGSCAIVCITLMAWYVPVKGAILKATIIVAIFKMMLSPQAPAPAYIAVFFQGLMGELLFWNRRYFRVMCVVLAVVAMLESALQRIISLTIIYSEDIWTAVNAFISKITGSSTITNYSYFIIFWYVMLHLVMGIVVGVWAGFLPKRIANMKSFGEQYHVESTATELTMPQRKRKKKMHLLLFVIWILLLGIYIQSFFKIGTPLLPTADALRILIRSVIVILTWYFLISPVLKQLLHKWLQRKKQRSAAQVQQVLNLLPSTQGLISRSWQLAAIHKGWKRISFFCKIILANTFYSR